MTSLLQTHDGYIWVGTRGGLARFDGMRFQVFIQELVINGDADLSCYDLAEDTRNRLWCRVAAGLVCYQNGQFERFSTRSGPLQSTTTAMTSCRHGGLWVGTATDGLMRFEDGRYTPVYLKPEGSSGDRVRFLREDQAGRVWVGTGVGPDGSIAAWRRLDPQTGQVQWISDVVGETVRNLIDIREESTGRLWLQTKDELLCWADGHMKRYARGATWSDSGTGEATIAESGTLWLAPPFTGKLVRFQQGRFEQFDTADGLADTDIRKLLWDREGNLWVGFGAGGLQRLRPRSLTSLYITNETGGRQPIDSVCSGRNGTVWLGTWTSLLSWQQGLTRRITNAVPWQAVAPGQEFDLTAHPVFEDRSGQVWFGVRDRGLFTIASNQVESVSAANDGLTNWTVHALHEDRAGTLWVGSDRGLLAKRGGHFVRFTTRDGLLSDDILGIREAPDGSFWVGTSKGLQQFRGGRFRSLTTRDGLLADQADPLLVEEDGTVWVGTPQGLNRIRGDEIRSVTERQGLYDNAPFCLLDDGAGYYWASSERGIFRMRKADLCAVADRRQDRVFCVSYGEAEGAASAEASGGYQPNACRTPDGHMWFATARGAIVLDPALLIQKSTPPPVVVEEVLADDLLVFADGAVLDSNVQNPRSNVSSRSVSTGSSLISLPAGRAKVLEIHYTANSFVAPEKVRFRYRLEDGDSQWREAGTRRMAFYTNLRPGPYRFLVKACNDEGAWSEHAAEFAFSIAPHFWETWPFYVLCIAGVGGLGAALQGFRLRWQHHVLKLEHQRAMEQERTRIARDLHDDIGASLTGVALQLEAAQRLGGARGHQLGVLATETRSLAHELRELAWTTNPRCDNTVSLAAFLGEHAERFCNAAAIECKLDLPPGTNSQVVPARLRHELLVVLKESLANVAKHAEAQRVSVSLSTMDRAVCLVIQDNGHGFDPSRTAGGNGVRNLRERIQQLGGALAIESELGSGTTVTARVPLQNGTKL